MEFWGCIRQFNDNKNYKNYIMNVLKGVSKKVSNAYGVMGAALGQASNL